VKEMSSLRKFPPPTGELGNCVHIGVCERAATPASRKIKMKLNLMDTIEKCSLNQIAKKQIATANLRLKLRAGMAAD
jgi:hypothetical protein